MECRRSETIGSERYRQKSNESAERGNYDARLNFSETLGNYLRNRRLSRNITLEEVSGSTGITTAILQALEDEDWEELPAEVYIKAFYKKYAQYLEADSEEALVKYQQEATSMNKPGNTSGFNTVITIKGKEGTLLTGTLRRLLLPVIVAALGVLIYWVYKNYLVPYNPLGFFKGYSPVLFANFPGYFPNFLC